MNPVRLFITAIYSIIIANVMESNKNLIYYYENYRSLTG
jgi:hypothetical protein